jgi:hypothetical protein
MVMIENIFNSVYLNKTKILQNKLITQLKHLSHIITNNKLTQIPHKNKNNY